MERISYSKQNYNQLKKKQYEEYLKRQKKYYLYMRKYYEEYIKRQKMLYLYRKRYYEEYLKKQNNLYKKKQYEEYLKKQKRYYLYKKINDERYYKRNNNYNSLENKLEQDNIEYKKYDLNQYENLENNNYFSYEESSREEIEEIIEEKGEEFLEKYNEEIIEEKSEEFLEKYTEEVIEEKGQRFIEEDNEKIFEENYEKLLGENIKELIEESEELLEEDNENTLEEYIKELFEEKVERKIEEFSEEDNEETLKENNEDYIGKDNKKFLKEEYENLVKEELFKENNIFNEGLCVKFPVILAEVNVTVPIEATITLEEDFIEIKEIKRNVFLTQSHLIPISSENIDQNSGILFIVGFIRGDIKYKAKTCITDEISNVCRDIRQCIVEVPFNFTTEITFLTSPVFSRKPTIREVEFFSDRLKKFNASTDLVIGNDPYEKSFFFTEIFNEEPFVELVKATFIEVDINKNKMLKQRITTEKELTQITEKIIIDLRLKVLQKQQLRIAIE